ncbi:MAG: hypothetical protein OEX00_01745 [Gammaproteobacteria bacterium]|nr:hypothetical protein [Gammaproteobacteria bacterium]MDH5693853.1 hypothetical protein [Gammaproteobacteria bacterium]
MSQTVLEEQQKIQNPEKAAGRDAVNLFLALAVGEIMLSTKEATGSIQELTKTFMDMVNDVHIIKAEAEKAMGKADEAALKRIDKMCDTFFDKVQAGTVGFQFYDKLTQRLQHTSVSLKKAMNLVESEDLFNSVSSWNEFRQDMRKRYNSEQDREMFEGLMSGKPIQEAVRIASKGKDSSSNVELF